MFFREGRMWFAILGPLLIHDWETPVDVPKGRQRIMLAALLMHAGNPIPADALAEIVWDGAPRPALRARCDHTFSGSAVS
jgi:hypothetical protein